MSEAIMTVQELSAYLDLAVGTIYKKVDERSIPFAKIGNLLRFPKDAIDRWVTENTINPRDSLFDEFARLQSRYHFKKWLEGKGIDPTHWTEAQLLEAVKKAIEDLQEPPKLEIFSDAPKIDSKAMVEAEEWETITQTSKNKSKATQKLSEKIAASMKQTKPVKPIKPKKKP